MIVHLKYQIIFVKEVHSDVENRQFVKQKREYQVEQTAFNKVLH